MTGEFVHTGQTLTGSGEAYCPLERKRRGAGALAAALIVMLAGGAFLLFSAVSEPQRIAAEAEIPGAIATIETADIATENVVPEEIPVNRATLSVDEAIAQSQAARAEAKLAGGDPAKPAPDGALIPRVKPQAEAAATDVADAAEPATPAPPKTFIASIDYASDEDGPPPFFFEDDIRRTEFVRIPPAVAFAGDISRDPEEVRVKLARGENFVDALERAGVSRADANAAAYAFGKHQDLRKLPAGQEFALTLGWPNQTFFQAASASSGSDARLVKLEYRTDAENRITVRRGADGEMSAEKKTIPLTTRVKSIAGRINGSLYLSAKHEGAPDEVIAGLADAFAYDVDFQREIFGGDEFEAIFEVRYDDMGKMVSAGDILYARLKWRGRSREKGYYRYADENGRWDFYDATGQSAKRLLMKTPIDGARLSSGFGTRKHPILGYAKAHKGVDFAASRGTPIKAAGDGTVLRADRYGSFGNYVKIRHANGYETAYAHLNGFARGIRKGKYVRQGDVIGYVGTTGRSTGPHLHYEVHLNGQAVNPQRLKIATGKKLEGAALTAFKAQRDAIDAMRLPEAEREALFARDTASAQGAL